MLNCDSDLTCSYRPNGYIEKEGGQEGKPCFGFIESY